MWITCSLSFVFGYCQQNSFSPQYLVFTSPQISSLGERVEGGFQADEGGLCGTHEGLLRFKCLKIEIMEGQNSCSKLEFDILSPEAYFENPRPVSQTNLLTNGVTILLYRSPGKR